MQELGPDTGDLSQTCSLYLAASALGSQSEDPKRYNP